MRFKILKFTIQFFLVGKFMRPFSGDVIHERSAAAETADRGVARAEKKRSISVEVSLSVSGSGHHLMQSRCPH